MPPSPCPPSDKLELLLADRLTEAEFAAVEQHVQECPACQDTLRQLSESDSVGLVHRLREAESVANSSTLPNALEKLRDHQPPKLVKVSTSPIRPEWLGETSEKGPLGHFGDYYLLAELGRGGFGVVYKAFDERLGRIVAVKVLRPERLDGGPDRVRFDREMRLAASVRHDHVVAVYHVGTVSDVEIPFLVMEYVGGGSLTDRIASSPPLNLAEAIEIVRQAALGLAAAHELGLVHRDVKPGNLLLERGSNRVKVSDFGLARPIAEDRTKLTGAGVVAGTPAYMSPEQIRTPDVVGSQADVYALGAVLYELLTGTTPFRGTEFAILEQVVKEEPRPPSRLDHRIPDDLDAICLMCLQKDPSRRYAGARELAEDLGRWQQGKPVQARKPGWGELAWRLCVRNKLVTGLIAAVVLALVAGTVVSAYYAILFRNETVVSKKNLREAETNLHLANVTLTQVAWDEGRIDLVRSRLKEQKDDLRGFDYYYWQQQSHRERFVLYGHEFETWAIAFARDGSLVSATKQWAQPLEIRRWDWQKGLPLPAPCGNQSVERTTCIAFSSTGDVLAVGQERLEGNVGSHEVRVWDVASGNTLPTIAFGTQDCFKVIAVAAASVPDGEHRDHWIAAAQLDGTVIVTRPGTRGPGLQLVPPSDGTPDAVALQKGVRDGWVALAKPNPSNSGSVIYLWNLKASPGDPPVAIEHPDRHVRALVFYDENGAATGGDESKWLAAGGDEGTIVLTKVTQPTQQRVLHDRGAPSGILSLAFSRFEGQPLLAAGTDTHAVAIWDPVGKGQLLDVLKGHNRPVRGVAFAADGTLASASLDRTVRVWDNPLGCRVVTAEATARMNPLHAMAISPDARVVTGGMAPSLKVWDVATGGPDPAKVMVPNEEEVYSLACSREGVLAIGTGNGAVWVRTLDGRPESAWDLKPDAEKSAVYAAAFCPAKGKEKLLALGRANGRVEIHQLGTTETKLAWKFTEQVRSVAFSPDGSILASAGDDGKVWFWDLERGDSRTWTPDPPTRGCWAVAFSPDGRFLAVGCDDQRVILLERMEGTRFTPVVVDFPTDRSIQQHSGRVLAVAFSPDGKTLASAGGDRTVKLWGVSTRHLHATLTGHNAPVWAVAFSTPKVGEYRGPVLVSADSSGSVRFWRAAPVTRSTGP